MANFMCLICNLTVENIEEHLRTEHDIDEFKVITNKEEDEEEGSKEKKLKLEVKSEKSKEIKEDYSIVTKKQGVLYSCKNCNFFFETFILLNEHSKIEHGIILKRKDCYICLTLLPSSDVLQEHLKTHEHQNHDDEKKKEDLKTGKNNQEKIKLKCLECGKSHNNIHEMKLHNLAIHNSKTFLCQICFKIFNCRSNLNLHNIYHHKTHKCSTCLLSFSGRLQLADHVKKSHPGIPIYKADSRFVCEYCSQSFSTRSQLSDHIQSGHLGKINQCEECGKILSTAETLRVHRLKHKPEKYRTCEHCGKQFYRTGMLTEHIRACHPEVMSEEWRQDTTCPYCHSRFTRRESLRRHIEAKHEQKMMICSFCQRSFTCRRYLVRHENKHHLGRAPC